MLRRKYSYKTGWGQCCWGVGLLHVGLGPQTERASGVLQPVSCISSLGCRCWGKQYEEGKKAWAHKFMKTPTCNYEKCKVWLDVCVLSLRRISHDYKQPARDKSVITQFAVLSSYFGFLCVSTWKRRKLGEEKGANKKKIYQNWLNSC